MEKEDKFITVEKTETEKVASDFVTIALTVAGESKRYAEAVNKADLVADAIIAALKEIKTLTVRLYGVNIVPVRDDKKVTGYRAIRNFSVYFDLDKKLLGRVFDILGSSQCEWHTTFTLKDSSRSSALLSKAVKSARESAAVIAAAAGVKLGKLARVEYAAHGDGTAPALLRASADDADPEQVTLSETVVCSWSIE